MENKVQLTSKNLNYYIIQFWQDFGDRRTRHLDIIKNGPWIVLSIMALYLMLVLKIVPYLMRSRQPFVLRKTMIVYNMFLVFLNGYSLIVSIQLLNYGLELFNIEYPSDRMVTSLTEYEINMGYLYFMTKFFDLFDTLFFVLRKKDNQITGLHLYHHTVVPILGWVTLWVRYNMPAAKLFVMLNSFVHVVMYSYYALAALGPGIQKYLWWKRYITQLQLVFILYINFLHLHKWLQKL